MSYYRQTWHYVIKLNRPRLRWLYLLLQHLCGRWRGHEWSLTEYGYGGHGIDRWCRWCNFKTVQPRSECDISPAFQAAIDEMDAGKAP